MSPSSSFSNPALDELKKEFIWLIKNRKFRMMLKYPPSVYYNRIRNTIIGSPNEIKEDIKFLKQQIKKQKSLLPRSSKWYRNKYKRVKKKRI